MVYELVKLQERACREALEAIGFKRRRGLYSYEINDEVSGWLGMGSNSHKRHGYVSVWPNVGVGHHELNQLLAKLQGRVLDSYPHATIVTGLGYLTPEHRWMTWEFFEGVNPIDTAREVVEALRAYAIPYYRSHSDLKSILPEIKPNERNGMLLPVALWLAGKRKKAEHALIDRLEEHASEGRPVWQPFREFAQRFSEQLLGRQLDPRYLEPPRHAPAQKATFDDLMRLQRAVVNACQKALIGAGFSKETNARLGYRVNEDTAGVVVLKTMTESKGVVRVIAQVGVRNQPIERTIDQLVGKGEGGLTIQMLLRELGADDRRWMVHTDTDISQLAEQFASDVFAHAALLLDKRDVAREYLESSLEATGSRTDPAAREFKVFAERLAGMLDS